MICPNCEKEYEDNYTYCPYCAEPKPSAEEPKSVEDKVKDKDRSIIPKSILVGIGAFAVLFILMYGIIAFPDIVRGMDTTEDAIITLIFDGVFSVIIASGYYLNWTQKDKRKKMISVQYSEDPTSICPHCGSHEVQVMRRGYNWNEGLAFSLLKIRGGRYIAGMDSRKYKARCKACGHTWVTNQEWRK